MIIQPKAKSPTEAFQKASDAIAINWSETAIARLLEKTTLVDYQNGHFVFGAPSAQAAALMNRRAEQLIMQCALELYMPDGITVSVEVVVNEVQP